MNNEDILKIKILQSSSVKEWNLARNEWEILHIYKVVEPQKCLCGHFPIRRICELVNKTTGIIEKVGSCCVTKFLDIKPELLYNSLQRIKENPVTTLRREIIDLAYNTKVITPVEYNFYQKHKRRTNLNQNGKQLALEINKRILEYFSFEQ